MPKKKMFTMTSVRKLLVSKSFSLDYNDQAWFSRSANLCAGVNIVEHKHNSKGLGYKNTYTVTAYQGASVDQHWKALSRVTLKEAVAWANENAEEAKLIYESER